MEVQRGKGPPDDRNYAGYTAGSDLPREAKNTNPLFLELPAVNTARWYSAESAEAYGGQGFPTLYKQELLKFQ
ncbi:MAG: hypothetical protein WKF92_14885 [Pyrinomonadaceae bacterium]